MPRNGSLGLALVLTIVLPLSLSAQPTFSDLEKQIVDEAMNNSQVMQNLEYLSYKIGPRLTGTDQMRKANEWTAEKFREYGLENVAQESWMFGYPWIRGNDRARIIEPISLLLTVAQLGFTPGTEGPVRGSLVIIKADSVEELEQYRGHLKGKFVLTREPASIPPVLPFRQQRLADTVAIEEPLQVRERDSPLPSWYQRPRELRKKMNEMLREEEILAVINDARKEHALLNMTGGGGQTQNDSTRLPSTSVFMIHEHYALLYRLVEQGENVIVEMDLPGRFGKKPVAQYNTVAEIPGSTHPDEVVIAGGHLDSWDLGQGTTDNGTGCMAVLEAARILIAVGAKPERTIRFIMFSGEEQGLLGSKAYVDSHSAEFDKISAVFVMDEGTGKIRGIGLQGRKKVKPIAEYILAPFKEYGVIHISLRYKGGSDHLPFDRRGVPAFAFILDPLEYYKTHHSQSDTFDHASEEDLQQAAAVIAVTLLRVANHPEMLPRRSEEADSGASN